MHRHTCAHIFFYTYLHNEREGGIRKGRGRGKIRIGEGKKEEGAMRQGAEKKNYEYSKQHTLHLNTKADTLA